MSSDATRERLLESAWRLLQRDPATASMARIAAAAGVSRQAVYLHFQSRAGLLLALVRWIDEREGIAARLTQAAGAPAEVLEAQVRAWLDYLPALHPVPIFLARASNDPEALAAWDDRMTELERLYRRSLRALYREGALRRGLSVEEAVATVRGIASVHTWHFFVHESGWKQAPAVDAILLGLRGALYRGS